MIPVNFPFLQFQSAFGEPSKVKATQVPSFRALFLIQWLGTILLSSLDFYEFRAALRQASS